MTEQTLKFLDLEIMRVVVSVALNLLFYWVGYKNGRRNRG